MHDRYNFQMVVLDTNKNIAESEEELRKQWEELIKQHFDHYTIVGIYIRGKDFQMVVLDTDRGTARDKRQLRSVWITRLDDLKLSDYRVSGVLVLPAMGRDR